MADVAACHQPITFDFAALVIHPVVCQIGQTGQPHGPQTGAMTDRTGASPRPAAAEVEQTWLGPYAGGKSGVARQAATNSPRRNRGCNTTRPRSRAADRA